MRDIIAKGAVAAALGSCLALGGAGALAALTAEATTNNAVSLDTVDIEIAQNGSKAAATVLGDNEIVSETTIENRGAPCWVRVRAHGVVGSGGAAEEIGGSALGSAETAGEGIWKLASDGYSYLTRALEEEEAIAVTIRVQSPLAGEDFEETFDFTQVVTAEAVQATAFEPDFDADEPWGDIEPEECVHARRTGEGDEGGIG